jgi:hypothetical protein
MKMAKATYDQTVNDFNRFTFIKFLNSLSFILLLGYFNCLNSLILFASDFL